MLTSTKHTLNYFNHNLFSQKKSGAALVISEAGKDSDSEEEEILRALRQPDMDRETEINTSLEDNGESMSTTLMPLPTLRVIRASSPPATGRNYIEVNSDDEPHPTDIFATSSDDEPASVTAIIANALGHHSSPVSDNSGTEPGDSSGMASNASDNAKAPNQAEEEEEEGPARKLEEKALAAVPGAKEEAKEHLAALIMPLLPRKCLEVINSAPKFRFPQLMQMLYQKQRRRKRRMMILMRCWKRIWNTVWQLSLHVLLCRKLGK